MYPKHPIRVTDGIITTDLSTLVVAEGSIGVNGEVDVSTTTPTPSTTEYALRFEAANNTHVNHGAFWLPGATYSSFYWDCLVAPQQTDNPGYIISAGYGGAHNLLLGTQSNGNTFSVTGNIWDGDSTIGFNSLSKFPVNEWHHIAVVWDLSAIIVYVNGVVEGSTTYEALTRSTPASTDSVLFVGGSDHLMGGFDLAWIRGFEGTLPFTPASYAPFKATLYPLAAFNNTGVEIVKAQFCADYTKPGTIIEDVSDGLSGVRHPGIRSRGASLGGFLGSFPAVWLNVDADLLPQWVQTEIVAPAVSAAIIPGGVAGYDSFVTRNNPPFWSNDTGLGLAETGQEWLNTTGNYGISAGCAFPYTTSETALATIETGSQTQDIRVTREGQRMKIIGRYVDANNYVEALFYNSSGNSALYLGKKVAGVDTQLFSGNVGSFDADLRMTISGTTVTVYMGGAQVTQQTSSPLPTGTQVGFNVATQNLAKVSEFSWV